MPTVYQWHTDYVKSSYSSQWKICFGSLLLSEVKGINKSFEE